MIQEFIDMNYNKKKQNNQDILQIMILSLIFNKSTFNIQIVLMTIFILLLVLINLKLKFRFTNKVDIDIHYVWLNLYNLKLKYH